TVLIAGGADFIGYHLIFYVVEHKSFEDVVVLSLLATNSKNCIEGVDYYAGDITNYDNVRKLLDQFKLAVVIHAASPSL
ncbi:NAD(P)-binding protein, partial [Lojkania enalia]